ncbi:MAG TPA: hypothetical protein VFA43_03650 [Gemmatimonadaceae bacterium]|nr:hypothetical protein [Gemmatimonadaceae bacterium]
MISRLVIVTLLTANAMGAQISRPWTVRYSRTGGIAGINERATLTDSGRLVVGGHLEQGTPVSFAVDTARIARVEASLASLHLTGEPTPLPKRPSFPDMMTITLDVTIHGRTYPVPPDAAGARLLVAIMDTLYREFHQKADDAYWARVGPFNPGRAWTVREEVRDADGMYHGESWIGRWERLGNGRAFAAVWHNSARPTEEMRDTLDLVTAEHARIQLVRRGTHQQYNGFYEVEKPSEVIGTIVPSHACSFWATVEY